ncbi:MAG: hypothetical protein Q9194_000440 [Teloschistes cf. exilis]
MAKEIPETSTSNSSQDSASGFAVAGTYEEKPVKSGNVARRVWDSFKQNPNYHITQKGVVGANGQVFDVESAAVATAESPLARKLKGRHLQMIAIGGSIGTGLFVGSGKALQQGGPASLLIAFALIGGMLFCTVQALGEMAVLLPVAGKKPSDRILMEGHAHQVSQDLSRPILLAFWTLLGDLPWGGIMPCNG